MADDGAQAEPLRLADELLGDIDETNRVRELEGSEDEEQEREEAEQSRRARRRREELQVQLEIIELEEQLAARRRLLDAGVTPGPSAVSYTHLTLPTKRIV